MPANSIAQYLVSGECLTSTLVWQAGLPDWVPLNESPLWKELIALSNDGEDGEEDDEEEGEEEEEEEEDEEEGEEEEEEEEEHVHHAPAKRNAPKSQGGKLDISGRRNSAALLDIDDPFNFAALEDELADPRDVMVSKVVYVEDEKHGWMTALVVAHDGHGLFTVERLEDKRRLKIRGELHVANDQVSPDMCNLDHISEPACVFNLGRRFVKEDFFTSMGVALVSINPCKDIPVPSFESYARRDFNMQNQPHPFATAQLAYDLMCFSNCSQSVLISGESGSGKSYTAHLIINYLVSRSYPGGDAESNSFDQRLLTSSHVLESFGHAKTQSTNSSSRFGKFIKLYYEEAQLSSAMVETFLLEKGRVLRLGEHERSFNIFYQLLAGKKSRHPILNGFQDLIFDKPAAYELLTHSDCFTFPGALDDEKFDILVESMSTVGFTEDQIQGFLKIVCGILHLGNIVFDTGSDPETKSPIAVVTKTSTPALEMAAQSLEVDVYQLHSLLTQRKTRRLGVETATNLSQLDAACARDWTIKSLYGAVFESLAHYLNLSLSNGVDHTEAHLGTGRADLEDDPNTFIALVDTAGFGAYELNDFEHFLINYTSEALELTYCSQIFEAEINLYDEEGIDYVFTAEKRPDNAECVELLSAKGKSVLSILDTVCRMPDSVDDLFLERLQADSTITKNKHFVEVDKEDKGYAFKVRHYAADVQYCCYPKAVEMDMGIKGNAWVSRNNDLTPAGLSDLCKSSGLAEMQSLPVHSTPDVKMSSNLSMTFKPSVASTVTNTVADLNTLLMGTTCLYVRCINPNESCSADFFDNDYVRAQMKALKIVESCEVFKAGFSVRITFEQIRDSVGEELGQYIDSLFGNEREELLVACLLEAFGLPHDSYKLGKSMVFFREDQLELIDKLLDGPGDSTEAQLALFSLISEKLHSAREAYEIADRVENEVEDLLNAISSVRSAAQKLHERFEQVEANPNALPGRIKALASVIKQQAHILDKVERMCKTTLESTMSCRESAAHCDLEEAQHAAAVLGEVVEQIIHQVQGLIASIEKANQSLAMIESDITDVEKLNENFESKAKREMEFRADQMSSMSEALLDLEREKSRNADAKRKEAESRLKEVEEANAALEHRLANQQSEREKSLLSEMQQIETQLASERNASHRKDLQTQKLEAELRLFEERAYQIEERRQSEERLMQERLRLVEERQHLDQELEETEHVIRSAPQGTGKVEGEKKRRTLLKKKKHVEHEIIAAEAKIIEEHEYIEDHMRFVDQDAIHHIEEEAQHVGYHNPDLERRIHQVTETTRSPKKSRRASSGKSAKRTPEKERNRQDQEETRRLMAEKAELEHKLGLAEARVEHEREALSRRKSLSASQKKDSEARMLAEIRQLVADRDHVQAALLESILNEARIEKEQAEESRREAEAYARELEGRLANSEAQQSERETSLAWKMQQLQAQQSEREKSLLWEMQQIESQLTSERNASHRKDLQTQKLEAELRLFEERAYQIEERRQSEERLMQERLRLVEERQHLTLELDRTHDAARKRTLLEKKGHVEHEIIAAEARIIEEHEHIEAQMQHVDQDAIHHIEEEAQHVGYHNPDLERRIHQAEEVVKRSSRRSRRKSSSSSSSSSSRSKSDKEQEETRRLMAEKAELEHKLGLAEARVEHEREALSRRKSLSASQKKDSEARMLAEIRQLVADRDHVQAALLESILNEVKSERLAEPSAHHVSFSLADKSLTEEEHRLNDEMRIKLIHENNTARFKDKELTVEEQRRNEEMRLRLIHENNTARFKDKEMTDEELHRAEELRLRLLRESREARMNDLSLVEEEKMRLAETKLQTQRELSASRLKEQERAEEELRKAEELRLKLLYENQHARLRDQEKSEEEKRKAEELRLQLLNENHQARLKDLSLVEEEKLRLAETKLHSQISMREEKLTNQSLLSEERLTNEKTLREEKLRVEQMLNEERWAIEEKRLAADAQIRRDKLDMEAKLMAERHAADQQRMNLEASNREAMVALEKQMRDERLAFDSKLSEERFTTEQRRLEHEATMRIEKLALERRIREIDSQQEDFRYNVEKKFRDEKLALENKLQEDLRAAKDAYEGEVSSRASKEKARLQQEHEKELAERERRSAARMQELEAELERQREARETAERAAETSAALQRKIEQLETTHAQEKEIAEVKMAMTLAEAENQRAASAAAAAAVSAAAAVAALRAAETDLSPAEAERRAKLAAYAQRRTSLSGAPPPPPPPARASIAAGVQAERYALEMERQAIEAQRRADEGSARAQAALQDLERMQLGGRARQGGQEEMEQSELDLSSGVPARRASSMSIGRRSSVSFAQQSQYGDQGDGSPFRSSSIFSAFADAETRDDERLTCVDDMVAFIREHCPHVAINDAKRYANTFYDARMKNMKRLARRLADEPTLWKNFLVDPYDAEEIEAALRSQGYFPTSISSAPLLAAVESEGGTYAQPFGRASRRASLNDEHGQSVSQDLSNVAAALQAVAARENKATVIQTNAPDPEVGLSIAVLRSELEQLRRESVMHQSALSEMQKDEAILKDKVRLAPVALSSPLVQF